MSCPWTDVYHVPDDPWMLLVAHPLEVVVGQKHPQNHQQHKHQRIADNDYTERRQINLFIADGFVCSPRFLPLVVVVDYFRDDVEKRVEQFKYYEDEHH